MGSNLWLWHRAQPTVRPRNTEPIAPGHLRQDFLPVHLLVLIAADQVDGPGAKKTGRDQRVVVAGIEFIAGDLLPQEAVVRLVLIERPHHVIAISPRVRTLGVQFVTVGIGITHHVQPALRPALAVVRRREQPVDYLLVGAGSDRARTDPISPGVGGRPVRSSVTRRKQSLAYRAAPRASASLRRSAASMKSIHRSAGPRIFAERNRRPYGFLVSPPVASRQHGCRVLIHPCHQRNSGGNKERQRFGQAGHWKHYEAWPGVGQFLYAR